MTSKYFFEILCVFGCSLKSFRHINSFFFVYQISKSLCNIFPKKIMQHFGTKQIMQPLGTKKITQQFETKEIKQALRTKKITQPLGLMPKKVTQPLRTKKIMLSIGPIASKLVHKAPNCGKWHQICPDLSKWVQIG